MECLSLLIDLRRVQSTYLLFLNISSFRNHPMSSDEGWEEVFETDIEIKVDEKELKSKRDRVIDMSRNIISIFLDVYETFEAPEISETIDYNIKAQLENKFIDKEDKHNYSNNLKLFKSLTHYGIFSRIYFVLDKSKSTFIETNINNKIIRNTSKWSGCVFYIDSDLKFGDYSWYFSRATRNYSIFLDILQKIRKPLSVNLEGQKPFDLLDEERRKVLPTSLIKFTRHPLYVLQSQLKYNSAICPKRPICGYFKGEPVYLRKNIIKLKTEKQFYKLGKELITDKPFKVYESNKLYSDFQVKDIVLYDLGDKPTQDYFHENHIPKNCIFVENEYSEQVCKALRIEYRRCFRGFNRGMPIISGVFIYKKDIFLFSNFLFEYSENIKKILENEKKLEAAKNWRKIFKLTTKYLEIRKKLDLDD